jgi:hypothetical protein
MVNLLPVCYLDNVTMFSSYRVIEQVIVVLFFQTKISQTVKKNAIRKNWSKCNSRLFYKVACYSLVLKLHRSRSRNKNRSRSRI